MTTLYLLPISVIPQWFTSTGTPAVNGAVQTYLAGTFTPVITYRDDTGLVPNANPLTLNSAGRAVSAQSGAPVAFWVPSGTVCKVIVYDSAGNQIQYLDNLAALDDPNAFGSLAAQLGSAASSNAAGTGPVAGADLVANAIKSYDVFADVRAANQPTLASGQTLNIQVQGQAAVNDGLGGDFYWSPASTAADNGATVLKPNITTGAGRWLRLYSPPFGGKGTVAVAATTDLGSTGTNVVLVNGGGAAITNFGNSASPAGGIYFVTFNGVNVITPGQNQIICPGGIAISTAAGDWAIMSYAGQATGWTIMAYFPVVADDIQQLVQVADQSVISSTAFVTSTNLATFLPVGTFWIQLRARFEGATTTTQGYNFELLVGATVVGPAPGIGTMSSNGTAAAIRAPINTSIPSGTIGDTDADMVSMDFMLVVSVAGTCVLRFSQNSVSVNATTLKAGSFMAVTRVA